MFAIINSGRHFFGPATPLLYVTCSFKDATSLTEILFETRENHLDDYDLEIGMKAKEVLDQCQSTRESEEDSMEREQQLSLNPSSEARFYKKCDSFTSLL